MPVLAKFLSTKFVAHSNRSYKDHLFFLLSGEKFLKFYWFDAIMKTDSNNQVELVKVAWQLNY